MSMGSGLIWDHWTQGSTQCSHVVLTHFLNRFTPPSPHQMTIFTFYPLLKIATLSSSLSVDYLAFCFNEKTEAIRRDLYMLTHHIYSQARIWAHRLVSFLLLWMNCQACSSQLAPLPMPVSFLLFRSMAPSVLLFLYSIINFPLSMESSPSTWNKLSYLPS